MAFTERHWRRYGHDRTYVSDETTGASLGYRDNRTGELVPEAPATLAELTAWAGGSPPALSAPDSDQASRAPDASDHERAPGHADIGPPDPATEWEDLAVHAPGRGARAKADAEWEARRAGVGGFRAWAARALSAHTDERAWRIGAAAEESIGRELDSLRDHGWHVLHSVTVGAGESDIDHVLVGPGGVLTVNSKHHPDAKVWVTRTQIRVNGAYVPYLRNSRHEAGRASRVLSKACGFPVTARACLVFRLSDGRITIKEDPDDVLILRATRAAKAIRKQPEILTTDHVERIYAAARRSTTWAW